MKGFHLNLRLEGVENGFKLINHTKKDDVKEYCAPDVAGVKSLIGQIINGTLINCSEGTNAPIEISLGAYSMDLPQECISREE